ncbi:MAG: hypothetical protein ABIA47_00970 [bacterium]
MTLGRSWRYRTTRVVGSNRARQPADQNNVAMEFTMIVNAIVRQGNPGERHEREKVQIPVGAWALIVNEQEEHSYDWQHLMHDSTDHHTFVMAGYIWSRDSIMRRSPNEVLLRRGMEFGDESSVECRRVLYWSDKPFALMLVDYMGFDDNRVYLARRVTEHGLAGLPDFPLPRFVKSQAGSIGRGDRPHKWARLSEVAGLCGLATEQVLNVHLRSFAGYHDGMLFLRASDEATVIGADKYDGVHYVRVLDELCDKRYDELWVTKRFALAVLYMHMCGYHNGHPDLREKSA